MKVEPCGMFVDPAYPYLAASPDGSVDDGLVEVKCPFTGRYEEIAPGPKFPFIEHVNNNLSLKLTHKYYDQVQGQLYLAKREKCYFVVYTFEDISVITVPLDKEYVEGSLLPKLQHFYNADFVQFVAKRL